MSTTKNFVIITNDSNGDKEATVVAISGNNLEDRAIKDLCYKALKNYNESDGSLTREDAITEYISETPGLEVSWPLVTYTVIDITD